eukprot:scaffold6533_cov117-Isochrysis_galbana.AAC.3
MWYSTAGVWGEYQHTASESSLRARDLKWKHHPKNNTCNPDASAVVPPPHTTWYRPTCGGKGWSARHAGAGGLWGGGRARVTMEGSPIRTSDVEECVANSPRRPHRRPSSQGRATGSNATGAASLVHLDLVWSKCKNPRRERTNAASCKSTWNL